mmetsp:Transcript_17465/g.26719  ORF Transcript_17465/g.26719 Transcript_17465/m.26719 type:complete len:213 (+) Transcript_17465:209-847(+)
MTSLTMQPARADALTKMQSSVSRYARNNDRRSVLKSIRGYKYLVDAQLEPSIETPPLQEAEDEVLNDDIRLNGLTIRSKDSLTILQEVCISLCGRVSVGKQIYKNLVTRMSRSAGAADAYFRLNSMLGSPELMMLPVTKPKKTHLSVELYSSDKVVHATISTVHQFGLFRKNDLVDKSRPWIPVRGIIHERVNLTTGKAVRLLTIKVPDRVY